MKGSDPVFPILEAELACIDAAKRLDAAARDAPPDIAFRLRFTAGVIRHHVEKIMPRDAAPDGFDRFPSETGGAHDGGPRRLAVEPKLPVVDVMALASVFVDGLYAVDVDRHGIARLIFTTEQREAGSARIERVVATRLLLPKAIMAEVAGRMLDAAMAPAADPGTETASGRPLN